MRGTGIRAFAIALAAGRLHGAADPAHTRARLGPPTIEARVRGGARAAPMLGLMAARTVRRAADPARPAEIRDHARTPDRTEVPTASAEERLAQGGRTARIVRKTGGPVTTVLGAVAGPASTAASPPVAQAADAETTGVARAGRAGARTTGRVREAARAGMTASAQRIGRAGMTGARMTDRVRGIGRAGMTGVRVTARVRRTGRAGKTGPVGNLARVRRAGVRATGRVRRTARAGKTGPVGNLARVRRAGVRATGGVRRTGRGGKTGVRVTGRGGTTRPRGATGPVGTIEPPGTTGPVGAIEPPGTTGLLGMIGRRATSAAAVPQTGDQHGTAIEHPGPTALGATRGTTGPLTATIAERPAAEWTVARARPTATAGRAPGVTFRCEKTQDPGSRSPSP